MQTTISSELPFKWCFIPHLGRICLVGSSNFVKLWDPPISAARIKAPRVVRVFSSSDNATKVNIY